MIRQSEEYVGLCCILISVVNVFLGADFPWNRVLTFFHHLLTKVQATQPNFDPLKCD